ncbi:hypothetical protein FP2506_08516 [Fulvimarina pelagi HTCC2506]|uniref:RNA signal recognition particle 4.5S RNA n=1 Tax=Fulvimarina pelagi HTCC2506 TaxID=314231 RepID=Q0G643_9HYPH|nr:DUF1428 domain-containing protein [Fulvimarina pelagi]EAU42871.1 hypothetical protein FP2506_08516 [Fulvimarina pelagi HTCC2506]
MYIQGFVTAVPTANKEAFIEHSTKASAIIREFGASRIVDTWGDDVPDGKVNDFKTSVKATTDETVSFGWMEFPDKDASDTCFKKMMSDPRMKEIGEMPFDGKRMIFGGFETLMDEGRAPGAYVDGFLLAVPESKREAYKEMSLAAWPIFRDHGVLRHLEAWGVDLPNGKVTDMRKAVIAEEAENVVFSFFEWPDKSTRDAGMKTAMEDERMKAMPSDMPFDGKRMIFGGFEMLATS